jgi:hypothetical protein
MNVPEMRSIIKKNKEPYEETMKRRPLFPEDEWMRYHMLLWFDSILNAAKKEDAVGDHISWLKDKGIKLYK